MLCCVYLSKMMCYKSKPKLLEIINIFGSQEKIFPKKNNLDVNVAIQEDQKADQIKIIKIIKKSTKMSKYLEIRIRSRQKNNLDVNMVT